MQHSVSSPVANDPLYSLRHRNTVSNPPSKALLALDSWPDSMSLQKHCIGFAFLAGGRGGGAGQARAHIAAGGRGQGANSNSGLKTERTLWLALIDQLNQKWALPLLLECVLLCVVTAADMVEVTWSII